MKKFIIILLALLMAFTLCSCDAVARFSRSLEPEIILESTVDGGLMGSADASLGDASAAPEVGFENGGSFTPSAGTLTAGEWSDLENIDFWTELLNRNDWYELMQLRDLYPTGIKTVRVLDSYENPCYNATVELIADDESVIYTSKTGVDGYAYLLCGLNKDKATPVGVRVNSTVFSDLAGEGETQVTLDTTSENVRELDLMFTIDTTGSMSDELRYLQSELADVISRVNAASDDILSIRISVNFYRDKGDKYVVLPFGFTENIDSAISTLEAQNTDGGGDYPEAVHEALDNSVYEHEWREDAVKLMFFVLDAPPHGEGEIQGINQQLQAAAVEASKQGIRIIPIASSGVDTETEFLLRSFSVISGGTYVFLTNHSGIGNDHLEPTIGEYRVEALNDCLVRIISEYCGL